MRTDLTPVLLDPESIIAIVGATDTPGKYGGIIYRDLKAKGFEVRAVNPNRSMVDGDPCYPSLAAIDEDLSLVVLVVPAPVGLKVLDDASAAGVDNIWVQPGASSSQLRDALDERGFTWLDEACVMVRSRVVLPRG